LGKSRPVTDKQRIITSERQAGIVAVSFPQVQAAVTTGQWTEDDFSLSDQCGRYTEKSPYWRVGVLARLGRLKEEAFP
jgi:hypothetical protein